jgi:hypothetical protein
MLWSYTTATGLTVFTDLVARTVVTVAIPYLFSACAQLTYLVSRRRRVQGWALARDLTVAGAGVLFPMWVTFAAGYQAVYQALIVVLAGLVVYAFLKAQRGAGRPGRRASGQSAAGARAGHRQVTPHRPNLAVVFPRGRRDSLVHSGRQGLVVDKSSKMSVPSNSA